MNPCIKRVICERFEAKLLRLSAISAIQIHVYFTVLYTDHATHAAIFYNR